MRNQHSNFIVRVIKGTGKTRYFTDWLEEKTDDGSLKIRFRLDDQGYVIRQDHREGYKHMDT